ncbi:MAG: HDOD domain-containing protein [Terriglobales bacterium]
MLTDGNHIKSPLRVGDLSHTSEGTLLPSLQLRQADELPLPPAMPDAVLLLRLLLSSHVADLHAITNVIRNDVGLAVQLFRLAALEGAGRAAGSVNVGDLIIQIGLEKLKSLAVQTRLNPLHPPNAAPHARERFWMHARLTARISEELASETVPAHREAAYFAGLLRHLGALPAVLGWDTTEWMQGSVSEIGYQLAKAWQIPAVLADVIRGDDRFCGSKKAHSLLRLVNVADERAMQWESVGRPMPLAFVWS